MRILHYSLGMYPKRAGGLNRYCTDLMKEQILLGHEVALFCPSGFRWWQRECFVSKSFCQDNVSCYKLVNSLPIPIMYGVRKAWKVKINRTSFERLYNTFRPEVLHLHTLMGLPEEALAFFKEKGVRIVFTSHDYFGICTKVNMIDKNGLLCDGPNPDKCAMCNLDAPSASFLRLRNSNIALKVRDFERWLKNTLNF